MRELEHLGPFFPGSRIGVLLVHGLAGTPIEMKFVARQLNQYGFSVLCPLLAGHCATQADLVATTWHDWADSLDRAYDAFSAHVDVIFIGGLSAGATLCLHLAQCRQAARNKDKPPRGLMLYAITLRWDGWSITRWRFLLPLVLRLPYIGKRYTFKEVFPYGIMNEKLRARIYASMQSGDSSTAGLIGTPGLSLRELWQLVALVKKELHRITQPALLIHARHDDIAHWNNAKEVYENLGGPAELMLLDNSYHMITLDQERAKVGDATAFFCANLLGPEEKKELARHAHKEMPWHMPAETLCRNMPTTPLDAKRDVA